MSKKEVVIKHTHDPVFNQFYEWLKTTKYKNHIRIENEEIYTYLAVEALGIVFGYCTKHDEDSIDSSYIYINGRITFENYLLFDKWSNSMQPINPPTTREDFDNFINAIDYIASDEYYNLFGNDNTEEDDEADQKIVDDNLDSIDHLFDTVLNY